MHDAREMAEAQAAIESAGAELWRLREDLLGWHRPAWAARATLVSDWFSDEDSVYDAPHGLVEGGDKSLQRGDIHLAPFPYSDLTGTKQRPVCVVSTSHFNRGPDVVVAMVTVGSQHGLRLVGFRSARVIESRCGGGQHWFVVYGPSASRLSIHASTSVCATPGRLK